MLADIDCDGRADIVLTYTEPNGYGYGSHMLAAAAYSYKTTSFSKQQLLYGFWDNWWKFRQIGALDMAAGNFYEEGTGQARGQQNADSGDDDRPDPRLEHG